MARRRPVPALFAPLGKPLLSDGSSKHQLGRHLPLRASSSVVLLRLERNVAGQSGWPAVPRPRQFILVKSLDVHMMAQRH